MPPGNARLPVSNNLLADGEAANAQPSLICRATTKTLEVWRVGFLDALPRSLLSCDGRVHRHSQSLVTGLPAALLSADYADYTDSSRDQSLESKLIFNVSSVAHFVGWDVDGSGSPGSLRPSPGRLFSWHLTARCRRLVEWCLQPTKWLRLRNCCRSLKRCTFPVAV